MLVEWRWVDLLLVRGLGLFVLFDIFLGSFGDDNDIIICYNGSDPHIHYELTITKKIKLSSHKSMSQSVHRSRPAQHLLIFLGDLIQFPQSICQSRPHRSR